MRDYVRLVKDLRGCNRGGVCSECSYENLIGECECISAMEKDAADAIEELLAAAPHWISVEERLPEENKNYLCYGVFLPLGVKAMDMYRFDGVRWRTSSDVEITHWMPLPEASKEELNKNVG